MPVGEVGVRRGIDTHRLGRIADVEQEAVSAAGTAGQPDRRVHGDVVALGRSGSGIDILGLVRLDRLVHVFRERLPQRRAVGRGRRTGSPTGRDHAVQHAPRNHSAG